VLSGAPEIGRLGCKLASRGGDVRARPTASIAIVRAPVDHRRASSVNAALQEETMGIDPARVLAYEVPETEGGWSQDDVILYHLGVGAGDPPTDPGQLEYVYEKQLKVLPSFAPIPVFHALGGLANVPGLEFDFLQALHGEQGIELHQPVPSSGRVVNRARVVAVWDKGKACVCVFEVVSRDPQNGDPIFTNRFTLFIRGAGGFGGDPGPSSPRSAPSREPDAVLERSTLPQQAALYRLTGDRNPLHIDPGFARLAGFERPPLHGLCSYGIACKAVVDDLLEGDVTRVSRYTARFKDVAYPGESFAIRCWQEDEQILLEVVAKERGTTVLGGGSITLASR
jgi:acyl dehydratase